MLLMVAEYEKLLCYLPYLGFRSTVSPAAAYPPLKTYSIQTRGKNTFINPESTQTPCSSVFIKKNEPMIYSFLVLFLFGFNIKDFLALQNFTLFLFSGKVHGRLR